MDVRVVGVGPGGFATVWPRLLELHATTPHAVAKGFWKELVPYDAAGRARRVARLKLEGGNAIIPRLRSARRQATLEYGDPRPYDLQELKSALGGALAKDDDVLTQFYDAEEIGEWLDHATTFADIVAALERVDRG
jgi:hypothetical protein